MPNSRASAGSPARARTGALACAAICIAYGLVSFLTFDQIEEDAFIYFRFAENIADGYGYVFNRLGERVEAGSGPLWLLWLVCAQLFSLNLVVASKLLGIAFGLASLCLLVAFGRRDLGSALAWCPALLLCASTPFHSWSQRGMESPLYVFALLSFALALSLARFRRWSGFAAALVLFARPEGVFVLAAALLILAVLDRGRELPLARIALTVGVLELLATGLRVAYFQDLLPHTFYPKIRATSLFGPLLAFARSHFLAICLLPAVAGLLGSLRRPASSSIGEKIALALLVPTVVWSLFGEDVKPDNRQLLPALPFLYFLIVSCTRRLGAGAVLERAVQTGSVALAAAMLLLAPPVLQGRVSAQPSLLWTALGAFAASPERFVRDTIELLRTGESAGDGVLPDLLGDPIGKNYQATTGKTLSLNYRAGTSFVYSQMGQAVWYAGADKHFEDSLGLTSRALGYQSFDRKAEQSRILGVYRSALSALLSILGGPDHPYGRRSRPAPEALLDDEPDVVMLHAVIANVPGSVDARLLASPRLHSEYREAYRLNGVVRVFERIGLERQHPLLLPNGLLAFDPLDE